MGPFLVVVAVVLLAGALGGLVLALRSAHATIREMTESHQAERIALVDCLVARGADELATLRRVEHEPALQRSYTERVQALRRPREPEVELPTDENGQPIVPIGMS